MGRIFGMATRLHAKHPDVFYWTGVCLVLAGMTFFIIYDLVK